MSWLVWRQHRVQFAAVLALLGGYLAAAVTERSHPGLGGLTTSFAAYLPALVGAFWGGPLLARELETGTADVAWTQAVTRRRWLGVRLAVLCAAAALAAGALLAVLAVVLDSRGAGGRPVTGADRLGVTWFESHGAVPVAYAVFAVALGALVGALCRRVLVAVAATLAAFVAVRALVALGRTRLLDSYWPAQLAETALFAGLTAAAVLATLRLVDRLG